MEWLLLVLVFETNGGITAPTLYYKEVVTQEECVEYSSFLNEQENVIAFCQPKNPQA